MLTKTWECEGCDQHGIADDEVFKYEFDHGTYILCLNCGPEENYENLEA
jgi:hypothetical protein